MKIVYVTPGCFDKGGISRYNRYQIQVLKEMYGSEAVKVLSLLGPDQHSFEGEYPTHWHGNGTSMGDKLSMVKQLLKLSWSWKPDLILIGHVNLSGLCWFAAKIAGATTILNVYGLEIWSGLSADASFGLKRVKHIISDCHNTADYLTKNQIRKPTDIEVIWDCVDVDRFVPFQAHTIEKLKKYGIPDPQNHFIILTLGRLSKPDAFYKGYESLVRVFARIREAFPAVRLVIAGRGNFAEDIKVFKKELNLGDEVVLTGSVDEEDLVEVYNCCDVFSLITEAGKGKGEGIPLTPLEAMACGKPILVGNQDGSREAVIGELNGFVLDPLNSSSHEQVLLQYLRDQQLLDRHSKNASEVARKNFSYDIFKRKHIKLFSKLFGKA